MSLKANYFVLVCIHVMPTGMMFMTNDIGNGDKHFDDETQLSKGKQLSETIILKQTIITNNYPKANNYHKQLSQSKQLSPYQVACDAQGAQNSQQNR